MIFKDVRLRTILIVITFTVILFCVVLNLGMVYNAVKTFFYWFSPVTTGLAIAYVMNVLMRVLEEKVFVFMTRSKRKWIQKMLRPLSLILTIIIFLSLIAVLIAGVLPDLQDSIVTVVAKLPEYFNELKTLAIDFLKHFDVDTGWIEEFTIDWKNISSAAQTMFDSWKEIWGTASSAVSTVTDSLVNILFSGVIAIYFLAQKERIAAFVKRVIVAFLPKKISDRVFHVATLSHNVFTNFVRGQCAEAMILGLLTFIGMTIFRFQYAGIISVVIGCTALVPIVGALIGEVFGAFLLLTVNPLRAFLFLVFILVLQQIEGSVIYPRVVGTSVGLPGIAVFSAVLVGGNIGGILGALLGVPVCAVLYTLLREEMDRRKQHSVTIQKDT